MASWLIFYVTHSWHIDSDMLVEHLVAVRLGWDRCRLGIVAGIYKFYEAGFALHKLFSERAVSRRTRAVRLVLDNRLAKAWRFTQTNGPGNDCLVNQGRKVLPDFVDDLLAE